MKFKSKILHNRIKSKNKLIKGFTLVELLVSMTITLIIVGLLIGMTKIAIGAWVTTNNKVKSSRLATEVFEVVGRDLEGLVVRSGNTFEWLSIEDNNLAGPDVGPGGGSEGKNIVNTFDINFFTATPDRYDGQIGSSVDAGGDVSMVRYRLIYQDVIEGGTGVGTTPVYSLYRDRVEPDEVFQSLLGQDELAAPLANLDEINEVENILADNIYDFTLSFNFEFTVDDGTKIYERVTIQAGGSDSLSIKGNDILIGGTSIEIPDGAASPRLASADISVFVISDGGMRALEFQPDLNSEEFAEFLKEHGDSYTKSVLLPQQ